jgi:hypothetical protein
MRAHWARMIDTSGSLAVALSAFLITNELFSASPAPARRSWGYRDTRIVLFFWNGGRFRV